MLFSESTNPSVRIIGYQVALGPGSVPDFDALLDYARSQRHFHSEIIWNMSLAYSLGKIHGKREERARRKKGRGAA